MNLVLSLDRASTRGIREQLTDQLRGAVLKGQVPAGAAMPSTRSLASSMGVARGTVVAIYEDLAGEGYVDIVPGSGTFVSAVLPVAALDRRIRDRNRLHHVEPEESVDSYAEGTSYRPGMPSTRSLGHADWRSAVRSVARDSVPATYQTLAGLQTLREAIASYLLRSRGFHCDPGDVIVTAGTSDALALIVLGLRETTGRPVRVACENPGHPDSRRVITRLGGSTIPIDVLDGGIDVNALARVGMNLTAVLVTPSHQYPLGGRLDVSRRLNLLEWASKTGAVVIEDDYDSEFRHGTQALPAVASLDGGGMVIHVGSFSKTISPWLRCGYLVTGNPERKASFLAVREDLGMPVSGLTQETLARYLHSGGLARHLARTRREYAHKQSLIKKTLKSLAPDMKLEATDGGLHAVLSWPAGAQQSELIHALRRQQLHVTDLADFYHPGSPPNIQGIVFGYGACSDLELSSIIKAIDTLSTRIRLGSAPL